MNRVAATSAVLAFEPADMCLVYGDDDHTAGVDTFVRAEMGARNARAEGGMTSFLVAQINCADAIAPLAAIHFEAEIFCAQRRHRPAVAVMDGRIDGDQIDPGAKRWLQRRRHRGRGQQPTHCRIPAKYRSVP